MAFDWLISGYLLFELLHALVIDGTLRSFVTPRNLYRYKLGKIIMTGICMTGIFIGIS